MTFGTQLSLNAVPSLNGSIPGVGSAVTIFESSFNTQAELESGQSGNFLLFSAVFTGISPGVTPLTLANLLMVDANALPNDISSSFTTTASSILVDDVPEPGSIGLVAAGIFVVLASRRFRP